MKITVSTLILIAVCVLIYFFTRQMVEHAYFEGQKDAINKDVRIKQDSLCHYYWSKSCWNNGSLPIYNPE